MPPPSNDFTALGYRIDSVERQIQQLQGQLQLYVPQRENDLRLQGIQESVRRIEGDVTEIRTKMSEITAAMIKQEQDARDRDTKQRESQDKLQIRVLWFIVGTIIAIGSTVLASYFVHLF